MIIHVHFLPLSSDFLYILELGEGKTLKSPELLSRSIFYVVLISAVTEQDKAHSAETWEVQRLLSAQFPPPKILPSIA